jgi:hypothetical protein
VGNALGMLVLGVLPVDHRAAAVFSNGAARGRWLDRSPLVRASRRAASNVRDAVGSEAVAGSVERAVAGAAGAAP